jgi:hypothetical protein
LTQVDAGVVLLVAHAEDVEVVVERLQVVGL